MFSRIFSKLIFLLTDTGTTATKSYSDEYKLIKVAICSLVTKSILFITKIVFLFNDLIFSKEQRIFILTGPNRGGD